MQIHHFALASSIVASLISQVLAVWNSTCPDPMAWGGHSAYTIPEYPRSCVTHPVDQSVAWKQIATEVTFDHSYDHNSQSQANKDQYRLWAHVLIYPFSGPGCGHGGPCGPDYAMVMDANAAQVLSPFVYRMACSDTTRSRGSYMISALLTSLPLALPIVTNLMGGDISMRRLLVA